MGAPRTALLQPISRYIYLVVYCAAYIRQGVRSDESESLSLPSSIADIDSLTGAESRLKKDFLDNVVQFNDPVVDVKWRPIPMIIQKIYQLLSHAESGSEDLNRRPLEVDVIRGLEDRPEKGNDRQMYYLFNMSSINGSKEEIVDAEFHVFKRRLIPEGMLREHMIRVCLFKILDEQQLFNENGSINTKTGATLLEAKQVSTHVSEWIVFQELAAIQTTVAKWIRHPESNHGFFMTATNTCDGSVNGTHVRFVQSNEHSHGKQPVLVVYTNQGKHAANRNRQLRAKRHTSSAKENVQCLYSETTKADYAKCVKQNALRGTRAEQLENGANQSGVQLRKTRAMRVLKKDQQQEKPSLKRVSASHILKRTTEDQSRSSENVGDNVSLPEDADSETGEKVRAQDACQKRLMYVSFERLGWSKWIVAPDGVHAGQCSGVCPFPLTSSLAATNNALLKSVSHFYQPSEVAAPCCVPEKLNKVSILYHEDKSTITMRNYGNMVVDTCGCR